jgi:hypothetical protein
MKLSNEYGQWYLTEINGQVVEAPEPIDPPEDAYFSANNMKAILIKEECLYLYELVLNPTVLEAKEEVVSLLFSSTPRPLIVERSDASENTEASGL